MNITYQEYLAEVRSIAKNAIEEAGEYEQDVYDTAHEAVDGHQWIIYYAYNDDVIRHSGNPDAWQDCYAMEYIGQLVVDEGMQGAGRASLLCIVSGRKRGGCRTVRIATIHTKEDRLPGMVIPASIAL
jgi:hypothetical protein